MRDYQRKVERPRLNLRRDAEGRLRASSGKDDIGDVWAEQKRIRLAQAIEQDRVKAEKRRQRKAKLAKLAKWRPLNGKGGTTASKVRIPKEVVINIGLPKLKLSKILPVKLSGIVGKKQKLAAVTAVSVAVLGLAGYAFMNDGGKEGAAKKDGASVGAIGAQSPEYRTILPEGKSAESLGGWKRVSPPDKDPVFAYVDTVEGVQINVSQQPLPEKFKTNTDEELAKLAEQFNATQKLTIGDETAYVGTSIKGPQSVIFARGSLLILMRSTDKVSNDKWQEYVKSLR